MNTKSNPLSFHCLVSALALNCLVVSVHGATSAKPAPVAAPAAASTAASQEVPKSVFAIPTTLKEGRNPFFPYSAQPVPVPDPTQSTNKSGIKVAVSAFVLNGITSPPKRTAMINGRTFEPGESGEVRLNTGVRKMIKCEEIRDDSAIINVDGQSVEIHLRSGL